LQLPRRQFHLAADTDVLQKSAVVGNDEQRARAQAQGLLEIGQARQVEMAGASSFYTGVTAPAAVKRS
jgi:hypothetical protein